jgi:uncharacterized protein YjbJ (UPF0337 family)
LDAKRLQATWEELEESNKEQTGKMYEDQVLHSRLVSAWGNGNFELRMELEKKDRWNSVWLRKYQKVNGKLELAEGEVRLTRKDAEFDHMKKFVLDCCYRYKC